jgi:hypothetical protein
MVLGVLANEIQRTKSREQQCVVTGCCLTNVNIFQWAELPSSHPINLPVKSHKRDERFGAFAFLDNA